MDGIHDLGGRQGYDTIDVHETEEPFHEPWEARVRGIVDAISRPADWSIDWFRHCRELIDPVDYLTRPYFDQWLQTYAAMMVNSGVATVEELANGHAKTSPPDLSPPMTAADVDEAKRVERRFDREMSRRFLQLAIPYISLDTGKNLGPYSRSENTQPGSLSTWLKALKDTPEPCLARNYKSRPSNRPVCEEVRMKTEPMSQADRNRGGYNEAEHAIREKIKGASIRVSQHQARPPGSWRQATRCGQ